MILLFSAFALASPGLAGAGAAASPAGDAASSQPKAPGTLETNLSRNGSDKTVGEPEIAVDPTNRNNLFLNWTTFPVPLKIGASVPNACGGLVSRDGGRHWRSVKVPVNFVPDAPGCADAVAAAGPDGTLYAGGLTPTYTAVSPGGITVGGLSIVVHGRDAVSHSTDWGRTWSRPVVTMGSDAARFEPGGAPLDTFDRPWLAVDQSNGTLYASGANLGNHERFVTASTDKAASFGPVYAVDSPEYPLDPHVGGGTIAAAHGALAVAYVAAQAPGGSCPCVIFETSTDHGKTFNRHVVPLVNAASSPRPFLAASKVKKGRFALTVLDATGTKLEVFVTDDAGETWQGPALVGEDPANKRFKPWLSYGSSGELALVWRTRYRDDSYDVWAAVSRQEGNHGPVFSAPVRVSTRAAQYPASGELGDDYSFTIGDDKFIHVGWGDSRNGKVQTWYGRIPLAAFQGQG